MAVAADAGVVDEDGGGDGGEGCEEGADGGEGGYVDGCGGDGSVGEGGFELGVEFIERGGVAGEDNDGGAGGEEGDCHSLGEVSGGEDLWKEAEAEGRGRTDTAEPAGCASDDGGFAGEIVERVFRGDDGVDGVVEVWSEEVLLEEVLGIIHCGEG